MININKAAVDALAPNASTIQNAKGLRRDLFNLNISEDGTLLFGNCRGSRANPYSCSMDFLDMQKPVPRCNCPSRQFPCKHVMGLLYAYADGEKFIKGPVPKDIAEKREKAAKPTKSAEEKRDRSESEQKSPSKAKISEGLKKIDSQLEGLELADKLIRNIILSGIAAFDAKSAAELEAQAKNLNNFYINGIKTAFSELLIVLKEKKPGNESDAIDAMRYFHRLVKKATEHLQAKKAAGNPLPDSSSAIEEQIGHIWTLDELQAAGRCIKNVTAVQLAFNSYFDEARKEHIDEGYFIELDGGKIFVKKNYRPVKAMKYIKQDDSLNGRLDIKELYLYPGGINPRGRWDAHTLRGLLSSDFAAISKFARSDFSECIKEAKNQIKNPLDDRNPVMLLKVASIDYCKNNNGEEEMQIADSSGNGIVLSVCKKLTDNAGELVKAKDAAVHFGLIRNSLSAISGQNMLVMFISDIESGTLKAKPLSAIDGERITRFLF